MKPLNHLGCSKLAIADLLVEEELERAAEKGEADISKKQTGLTVTTMAGAEAEAVAIPVEEQLERAAEKLEAYISKKHTKIHRFPVRMRSLGNDGGYVVPNVVAIGPYHRHQSHLLPAEEIKLAAAHYFCRDSGHPAKAVYERIFSVAAEARSCYDDDATDGISEVEFAAMMFHDGCFLVQFMLFWTSRDKVAPPLEDWFNITRNIRCDVFLLENQIPWHLCRIANCQLQPKKRETRRNTGRVVDSSLLQAIKDLFLLSAQLLIQLEEQKQ
ncbi:hypothetical protein ABZP36_029411 [Zizania latifolia]